MCQRCTRKVPNVRTTLQRPGSTVGLRGRDWRHGRTTTSGCAGSDITDHFHASGLMGEVLSHEALLADLDPKDFCSNV